MDQIRPSRRDLGGVIAAAAFGALPILALGAGGFSLRRGVNIYHMMEGAARNGVGGDVVWPPFVGPTHDMPDAQIGALSRAGFDFVRLTLAPDVFLRASGTQADQLYALLRANVGRFTAHGLGVVVVMMPGNGVQGFTNADIATDNQGVFEALCEVLGRCALVLRDLPGRVAIEPLNEPAFYGLRSIGWGGMQQRLHQAVRAAAPTLPVILSGAEGGGQGGLVKLDPQPYRGSNVFYTFHYYDPHIFTHQHVADSYKYLSGVSWPPRAQDLPAAIARARAALAADGSLSDAARGQKLSALTGLLTPYYRSGQGPQTVAGDFARVAAWADAHRINRRRILLGEFGVTRTIGSYTGAPEGDAAAWLSAVRTSAERSGFAWSLWAYSGPVSMTLANEYPARTWDPNVLQALGLAPVQP